MCRGVADLVLLHLKLVDLKSLNGDRSWSAYARIAGEALRERGIDLDRHKSLFSSLQLDSGS
jgi:hypothetical protein